MPNELMKTLTIGANTYDLPQKTSDLTNDSGFITSESDPIFTASAAHGITSSDITSWNNKGTYSKPSGGIPKTDLASAVQTSLGKADTALQSYTETDPTVPSWAKASSKPTYTKSEVGLGNVDNVQQYSAGNPPPYPVTSVNGSTGAVTVTVPTKVSDLTNDSGFITSTTADDTYLPKSVTTSGGLENSITYAQPTREESSVTITSKYGGKAQLELYTNGSNYQNGAKIKVGSTTSPTTPFHVYFTNASSNTYTSISSTNTTINSTTTTINGVVTPTADGMAANKKYVDDSITAAIGAAIGGSY